MRGIGQRLEERPFVVEQPVSEARKQCVELFEYLESLQYKKVNPEPATQLLDLSASAC